MLGFTRPFTTLPTRGVFGFHRATAICYRYQDVGYQTLQFKSIKDSLGLLNPGWLFRQLGKLSLKQQDFLSTFPPQIGKFFVSTKRMSTSGLTLLQVWIYLQLPGSGGSYFKWPRISPFFCLVTMLHAFSGKKYHWFQVTLDENVPESVLSQLLFSLLFSLTQS